MGQEPKKQLSIDVGLSDEEIESSSVKREGIKMLWSDLLESKVLNDLEKLEDYLRKENEIVNAAKVEKVSRASGIYLRNLITHLDENQLDYSDILKSLGLILTSIPSRPWIVYGNYVEEFENAEFLMEDESAYLLAKFLSEVEAGEKHVYAARAMVDQMQTIAKWLKIDPFDVFEYEGRKLQLWDLTKRLFEKHLKFEASGKRASVADDVLIERWSDRREINNNKHIYYGLREVELPTALLVVDPVNRKYAWEDDQEFLTSGEQPNGFISSVIKYPPHSGKALNILSKWIENYERLNDELNEILRNPNKKIKRGKAELSPIEKIWYYTNVNYPWNKEYFPNSTIEARKDIYETILFSKSEEARNSIILYGYSLLTFNSPKWLEEVRVELSSCYGSITGYPIYREYFNYPQDKRPGWIHGETSFILNNYDESLLVKRSNEPLLIEKDTYSLNLLATRLNAAKKDGINFIAIILPSLECKRTSLY